MVLEQLAVLVYGVIAIVAALTLSSQVDAPLATALVFVSAGLTYLFQVVQVIFGEQADRRLWIGLWAGAIVALLLSVILSLWSAAHVL